MNTPQPQFDVLAVGRAASDLRVSLSQLLAIADRLGVVPVGKINGVPYLSASDFERIAEAVRASQRPAGIVPREPTY